MLESDYEVTFTLKHYEIPAKIDLETGEILEVTEYLRVPKESDIESDNSLEKN